jgi:phage terminase large subunit-like protein
LTDDELELIATEWPLFARLEQLPAETGPWRTWLILGGRGAGKTRAGAEWIRAQALGLKPLAAAPAERIALIGESLHDVRAVMIEGVSGLLSIHARHERPTFEPTKRQIKWPNGAVAQIFSAEEPDSLRGPQFAAAWCDEIAKWRLAEATWDNLQLALRLGTEPRVVATTTPRPVPLLRRMLTEAGTIVSHMTTSSNAENLSPVFVAEMRRRYAGTALGRQELEGEILADRKDALWKREWLDANRCNQAPLLSRVVVAVDPPATSGKDADACGIVVAGKGEDRRGYVLADRTLQGLEPLAWARAAVEAYRQFAADCLVAEVNQGGDMVEAVIKQVAPRLPVKRVRATRGKWVRAEPVAALYADGRVSHVGELKLLEEQLCNFGPGGLPGGKSPDRLDALVWALTELMLESEAPPAIRVL